MSPGLSPAERRRLLQAALRLAAGSRRLVARGTARGFKTALKSDRSPVTDVDRSVERFLRREIGRLFPEHGFLGEEFGALRPDSAFQWIVDPIDGTASFTRGIPLYGTIIALHHEGLPVLGVIDHPGLDERVWAARGLGAYRDGRRIRIADLPRGARVEDEIVATGDRAHFQRFGAQRRFDALLRRHPLVRSYADCFGHTLAARGAVGAMVDFGVKIWDVAATRVIIEEAGGKYACLPTARRPGGDLHGVVFGKPRVVDWLLKRLS